MRRVFKGIAVVAVVVSLAVPAQARTREDEGGTGKGTSIVQLLKQWIVRGFGDGLIVPRP